jgi:hypothetical protein
MSAHTELMTSEEIKKWILCHAFPPLRCDLPMRDRTTLSLQDMGFERIRVTQVINHPVWNVSAQVGQFRADSVRSVKIALKRICGELGFRVRMKEIVGSLYRGRLNAALALVPADYAPPEVEDDGERLPESLEGPP